MFKHSRPQHVEQLQLLGVMPLADNGLFWAQQLLPLPDNASISMCTLQNLTPGYALSQWPSVRIHIATPRTGHLMQLVTQP